MSDELTPEQQEIFDKNLERQITTFSEALGVELEDDERARILTRARAIIEELTLGETLVLTNIIYNHCRRAMSALGIEDENAEASVMDDDEGGDDEAPSGPSMNGNGRV